MYGGGNTEKRKILMVATVPSMIGQFNMGNIHILLNMGYEVHVACNFEDLSAWTEEEINKFKSELSKLGIEQVQVAFSRVPYDIGRFLSAYVKMRKLLKDGQYYGLHCHTPVAGVIARLAALKTNTIVIYTAHGFHFYKGAPIKNWLIYYPIEKMCSYMTDTLITINKEDYALAKKKMHAKRTVYVPGVGIDLKKFGAYCERGRVREKLKLPKSSMLLLSVGELNENKNHEAVIKALSEIREARDGNIYYIIAGQGKLENKLKATVQKLGMTGKVILLGHRTDVASLYHEADVFIFPSFREGLSVALMEAMASGLPIVCSKIRGNTDLINEAGGILYSSGSMEELIEALRRMISLTNNERRKMGKYNMCKIRDYDSMAVKTAVESVYCGIADVHGGGYNI